MEKIPQTTARRDPFRVFSCRRRGCLGSRFWSSWLLKVDRYFRAIATEISSFITGKKKKKENANGTQMSLFSEEDAGIDKEQREKIREMARNRRYVDDQVTLTIRNLPWLQLIGKRKEWWKSSIRCKSNFPVQILWRVWKILSTNGFPSALDREWKGEKREGVIASPRSVGIP